MSIGGAWSVVSDGGSVYRGASGSGNSTAGSASWTDQTVEARVKVAQFGNTKRRLSRRRDRALRERDVVLRLPDDGNGALRLLANDDMPSGRTGTCGKIDANLSAGSWHTFRLRVSGAASVRLQTFLDGTAIHDCTSTSGTIPAGAVGTYVYGANTIVEFDDLKVSTP